LNGVLERHWVLAPDARSAGDARHLLAQVCQDLPSDTADVAGLLVTELVANAVLHGAGRVLLTATRRGGTIRVEVSDEGPGRPVVQPPDPYMEHGRGLRLVDGLSTGWGTCARTDHRPGKTVWFELR